MKYNFSLSLHKDFLPFSYDLIYFLAFVPASLVSHYLQKSLSVNFILSFRSLIKPWDQADPWEIFPFVVFSQSEFSPTLSFLSVKQFSSHDENNLLSFVVILVEYYVTYFEMNITYLHVPFCSYY